MLACLALFSYTSAASAAGSLRCNGKLIRVGVPAAYVFSECGVPENRESVARAGTLTGASRIIGIALSRAMDLREVGASFPPCCSSWTAL